MAPQRNTVTTLEWLVAVTCLGDYLARLAEWRQCWGEKPSYMELISPHFRSCLPKLMPISLRYMFVHRDRIPHNKQRSIDLVKISILPSSPMSLGAFLIAGPITVQPHY